MRRTGREQVADLIATLVDDLHDVGGQAVLLPVADGVGDLAALGGDAVILPEDSPVAVRHLLQLLLGPVPVVPALLRLLLPHLLQPQPGRRGGTFAILFHRQKHFLCIVRTWPDSLLLLFLLQRASLLHQISVETGLVSLLLLEVDPSDEASPIELHLVLLFVSDRNQEARPFQQPPGDASISAITGNAPVSQPNRKIPQFLQQFFSISVLEH